MIDLIGHISGGITLAKGLYEICKGYDNAALMKNISDLTLQLAELQITAAQIITENSALKAELETRESNPLKYDGLAYRDNDNFPYCPGCFDGEYKRIHLKPFNSCVRGFILSCPVCKEEYETGKFDGDPMKARP